jgi:hypothetical protein
MMRSNVLLAIALALVIFTQSPAASVSSGPTILSGPTFTPAASAPLAGTLQVTTDVSTRVGVQVSDGTNVWQRDFYDFSTNHSETLVGFKAGRTNLIQVTVYDQYRNSTTAPGLLTFTTAPLPANFPTRVVLQSEPSLMEPGYTLFIVENKAALAFYITMIDNSGDVVWYATAPTHFDDDVLQLADGNLFITDDSNKFYEMNLLGQIVKTWLPPAGTSIDIHGGVPTDHGTIIYLSDVTNSIPNFPTSTVSNAPLGTVRVVENTVMEIAYTNGALLNEWQINTQMDRTRITYLAYDFGGTLADNEHANALIEDPSDNSIIVSMRNQNAVVKFLRSTGQIKWILGAPENWDPSFQQYLFTPVGSPFAWSYGQHAPMLTTEGTLLMYDDGNYRTNPYGVTVADSNNYSRSVEFSLNETNMQVSQVWDSSNADEDRLYTPNVGKAQWLPQKRNILTTYGNVTYINGVHPSSHSAAASMSRIIEYTHDPIPQVVFDLSFFDYTNTSPSYQGYFMYRATRVPDLYAHPANPVTSFLVKNQGGAASVNFSADPVRSYVVQASPDLVNWTTIGSPTQNGNAGDYEFDDLEAGQIASRFYRVITQ